MPPSSSARTADLSGKSASSRISCAERTPFSETEARVARGAARPRLPMPATSMPPVASPASPAPSATLPLAEATVNAPGRRRSFASTAMRPERAANAPETLASKSRRPPSATPKALPIGARSGEESFTSSASPARPSAPLATRRVSPMARSAFASAIRPASHANAARPAVARPANRLRSMSRLSLARRPLLEASPRRRTRRSVRRPAPSRTRRGRGARRGLRRGTPGGR